LERLNDKKTMSRDKKIQAIRNDAILKEYNLLAKERVGSAQKYTTPAILEMLSQKFFLSPDTFRNIIGQTKKLNIKKNRNVSKNK
jgi:hypothetical protein